MRFLHGTLVFSFFLLLSLIGAGRIYAVPAPWFITYNGGVISGSDTAGNDAVVNIQPYSVFPLFKTIRGSLVQPGVFTPSPTMPNFIYGGIVTRGNFDVKQTNSGGVTSSTDDAFVKNTGALGDALPNYQRFLDVAITIPCGQRDKLLTSCNLDPGIYKASLADINASLDDLNGQKYHIGPNTGGLLVLVQEDPTSTGTLTIKYNIQPVSSAGYKRLVLITNGKINIASTVGNTNAPTQDQYIIQEADIQAMLVTTSTSDPAIEVATGSSRLKIDGLLVSKGKVQFRRDAGTAWPGVFVQFNPFYITELAKLDASLSIFGASSTRWIYE